MYIYNYISTCYRCFPHEFLQGTQALLQLRADNRHRFRVRLYRKAEQRGSAGYGQELLRAKHAGLTRDIFIMNSME